MGLAWEIGKASDETVCLPWVKGSLLGRRRKRHLSRAEAKGRWFDVHTMTFEEFLSAYPDEKEIVDNFWRWELRRMIGSANPMKHKAIKRLKRLAEDESKAAHLEWLRVQFEQAETVECPPRRR